MEELVAKLNDATKAYDEGHPIMTDEEWDNLYFQLLDLERETGITLADSPTQKVIYDVVNALPKVEHNHKMLSLDKTKSEDEVNSFLGNHEFIAMAKMDGLTCSLRYLNGELVSAETRGNGIIGEDVTHNAKVIPSIPKKIDYQDELIVDGEIVCMWNDFQTFITNYKNPRNFAAGSIRLLDSKVCAQRKLTFVAWDVIKGIGFDTVTENLEALQKYGFEVVPWVKENPTYAINDVKDFCADHNYPIDGVVFKFDNIAYGKSLGETGHHFKNAIAYKFYDDEYETTLKDIEWSMGRTGILTPVAVFDPVDIDGSTVERASLHNISVASDILGTLPYVGERIWVYKANMIIPQISKASKRSFFTDKHIDMPKICPICGGATEQRESDTGVLELYCTNPTCEGKLVNKIDHFLGKKGLDVKGISVATLEKLIEYGWVNCIEDIYNLAQYKVEWSKKPGFGEKSVENMLAAIEASKECQLDKFICAIGIPLIGTSMSKTLAKAFGTWNNFRKAIIERYDFTLLDDFGYITADEINKFNYTEADNLTLILHISYDKPEEKTNSNLVGKKIVITGTLSRFKNRAELQSVIESAGGKTVSSVTKNTDILINNDINSTSAKNVSAKKLNIPIITEEEFLTKYID